MKRRIHLICHAHLDPVWLWKWEEGLTETLSTFRVAAEFCEKHDGFVFCHNESLLYRWVEEHDPDLFRRIRKMVKAGRWHIMGGAYLQPDINLPSGESHVRQFLYAIHYFKKKFGVRPRTGWNIDSFGQAEGFPQILAGCGLNAYFFSRPRPSSWKLPPGPFVWSDRSGAEVLAQRYDGGYNTRGNVEQKLDEWLDVSSKEEDIVFLWGFGDHGGGPSRREYRVLQGLMKRNPELTHSTLDTYFDHYEKMRDALPAVTGELQNASLGCFTSMLTVKRAHREAESLMAGAERMAALAWWRGMSDYPASEIDQAWRHIMFGEFHDILTGTCIPQAEEDTMAMFGLCHETIKRVRTRVFLKMIQGEPKAKEQVVPVFVFNPHAFPVETDLEFCFTHSHGNDPLHTIAFKASQDGRRVPVQRERGLLNPEVDWNLQACAHVKLPPLSVKRLDLAWKRLKAPRPVVHPKVSAQRLRFSSRHLEIVINPRTGLVDRACPAGSRKSCVSKGAFRPVVFPDSSHSWKCGTPGARGPVMPYGNLVCPPWEGPDAAFRLASRREAAAVCAPSGGRTEIDPIRIIEDGAVRTIVEAIFVCRRSTIIRSYVFSRNMPLFEIRDRLIWHERSTMLKIEVPLAFSPEVTVGETPYSAATRPVPIAHIDQTNQRWVRVHEDGGPRWLGMANTASYAHSIEGRSLFVNVVRSPAYGSSWREAEVPEMEDRYIRRHDQGVQEFSFGLLFGSGTSDAPLARAAGLMNVKPVWMSYHPAGPGRRDRVTKLSSAVEVSASNVEVTALKRSENGKELVIRLMEHAGRRTNCELVLRNPNGRTKLTMDPYRLKTVLVRKSKKGLVFRETNLVEE